MAERKGDTERKVSEAFHEVYEKVPKSVKATGKTGEAKRKMMTAIALSKARAAGVKIPKMHEGGVVPETGIYELEKGEIVVHPGEGTRELPHNIPSNEFSEVSYKAAHKARKNG